MQPFRIIENHLSPKTMAFHLKLQERTNLFCQYKLDFVLMPSTMTHAAFFKRYTIITPNDAQFLELNHQYQ